MIKRVVYGAIDSNTPARFYYDSRVLLLNENIFPKFSRMAQKFIVYHEFAHADGIFDEQAADEYAFNKLIKGDHSLRATVEAVAKALPFNTPEGRARIIEQFNRAADYDFNHNGNKKADIHLTTTVMDIPNKNNDFYAASMLAAAEEHSNFLGIGKKAAQARAEKKEAKNEIRQAKAEAIRSGTYQSGASKALGGIVDGAKKFLGISEPAAAPVVIEKSAETTTPTAEPAKNKTWVYVLIGVAVLAVMYFIFTSKKK